MSISCHHHHGSQSKASGPHCGSSQCPARPPPPPSTTNRAALLSKATTLESAVWRRLPLASMERTHASLRAAAMTGRSAYWSFASSAALVVIMTALRAATAPPGLGASRRAPHRQEHFPQGARAVPPYPPDRRQQPPVAPSPHGRAPRPRARCLQAVVVLQRQRHPSRVVGRTHVPRLGTLLQAPRQVEAVRVRRRWYVSSSTAAALPSPHTHPSLPPCCTLQVPRCSCHGHTATVTQVDFSADGAYIMSNCARREQMLWALPNGSRVQNPARLASDAQWLSNTR